MIVALSKFLFSVPPSLNNLTKLKCLFSAQKMTDIEY